MFFTDHDVFSDEEMATLPVFADYLRPQGYGKGIATALRMPDHQTVIFHAEGDYRKGPYSSSVFNRMNALRPHLARSALLSAQLAFEQTRTAIETLALLGYPACAVEQSGKVILANLQFEEASGAWTTRARDRIALIERRANEQLNSALNLNTRPLAFGRSQLPPRSALPRLLFMWCQCGDRHVTCLRELMRSLY